MMNALIIGGSSGLGLELGLLFANTHRVFVTGRKNPEATRVHFLPLEIDSADQLSKNLNEIIESVLPIDLFIYSAGFYQDGTISELGDSDIAVMIRVGLMAPAMLLQRILQKQAQLPGFIAVTSNSQWTPRLREPVYTAVKAGLGMLAQSVSADPRVMKTLVVAPAGMRTNFWKGVRREGVLLEPQWVAKQVIDSYKGKFSYKHIHILREPPRVEVISER